MWIGDSPEQRDCLFYAVEHENADMLSYLLSEVNLGARVNDQKITSELDQSGQSLLHLAAIKGNERIIFELAGDEPGYFANVNATDEFGNTPLHFAAKSNKPSAARFLMSLGAEIDSRND